MRSFLLLGFLFLCCSARLLATGEDLTALRKTALAAQGRARIEALHDLSEALRSRFDSSATRFDAEALQLAQSFSDPELVAQCLNHLAATHIELGNYAEAEIQLSKVDALPAGSLSAKTKAVQAWKTGVVHRFDGNYALSDFYLKNARRLSMSARDTRLYADITADLAENERYQADYKRASELNLEALGIFEALQDSARIMDIHLAMGMVGFLRMEIDDAMRTFQRNRDFQVRQGDSAKLGFAYTLLGLAAFRQKDYDAAIQFGQTSVAIRMEIGDLRGLGESFNNLALGYMGKGDWAQAGKVLTQSLAYLHQTHDLRQIPVVLGNIGDTRDRMGLPDSAIYYYEKALEQSLRSGLRATTANIYRKIARFHRQHGQHDKASDFLEKYAQLRDSIFQEEKTGLLNTIELRLDAERKEQQIAQLAMEKAQDQRRLLLWVGGMSILLLLAGLIASRQRMRIHRDKLLHQKETQIFLAREALTEAELRNTRNELAFNQQMLASYMESILSKNALVEQLEEQLLGLAAQDQPQTQERQMRIQALLDMKILTEEDWEVFKRHFEQVHHGLLFQLKERFPDLTVGEQRMFILVKLKLNSKEISNILGVSPESVKKNRHRLRKKLQLEEEASLEGFVEEFS